MIRKQSIRSLVESQGSIGAARTLITHLGLDPRTGHAFRDVNEQPCLMESQNSQRVRARDAGERLRPREFSLRELAESFLGESWASQLQGGNHMQQLALLEQEGRSLLEAGTNMVTPTAFANINAFTAVVTGLLEISLMEGWQNPVFIADQLAPVETTRMFQGRKVIGTARLGDVGEPRSPGMPTKRAGFAERWILQPPTVENALSCEVTQEAVYLDLTGEVLDHANAVGEWIAWRKEIRVIDAFIGVTNTYQYKGTSFNSYLSASTWNNDLSSNELVDWTNLETILLAFREMKDPETNLRVQIVPNRILVNQEKLFTARGILGATQVQRRNNLGTNTGTTNTGPLEVRFAPNPVIDIFGGSDGILTSPLVYQRMTDSTGLNLSASNAGKYYFVWEAGKPLKYAQNWPLRVQQAAPNQLDMIDRGIVLFVKADERGVPMWYEPRRIVRSHP